MKWISIKDRLPYINSMVLVACVAQSNCYCVPAMLCDDKHRWFLTESRTFVKSNEVVTHWMPIPKRPVINVPNS